MSLINVWKTTSFLSHTCKFLVINVIFLKKNNGASQVVLVIKNPPANAGDIRDAGLIPVSGRLEESMATHSSILA